MEFFCYLWTGNPRFRAYSMSFIARCGFLILSLIVVFAFIEVRYDAIHQRDKGTVSVNFQPTVNFRGWSSGVTPCVLRSGLVPPCPDQWLKGGKRVGSTMHWFLEASCFCAFRCSCSLTRCSSYSSLFYWSPAALIASACVIWFKAPWLLAFLFLLFAGSCRLRSLFAPKCLNMLLIVVNVLP